MPLLQSGSVVMDSAHAPPPPGNEGKTSFQDCRQGQFIRTRAALLSVWPSLLCRVLPQREAGTLRVGVRFGRKRRGGKRILSTCVLRCFVGVVNAGMDDLTYSRRTGAPIWIQQTRSCNNTPLLHHWCCQRRGSSRQGVVPAQKKGGEQKMPCFFILE